MELLARGLMTVGSYWTAPEAMWKRICVPVALTCGIGRGYRAGSVEESTVASCRGGGERERERERD